MKLGKKLVKKLDASTDGELEQAVKKPAKVAKKSVKDVRKKIAKSSTILTKSKDIEQTKYIYLFEGRKKQITDGNFIKYFRNHVLDSVDLNMQNIKEINDISKADVVLFVINDTFVQEELDQLLSLPNAVIKVGVMMRSTKPNLRFEQLTNLIVLTHEVNHNVTGTQLKSLLKMSPQTRWVKLPLSPLFDVQPENVSLTFDATYSEFAEITGYYELLANALSGKYSEVSVNCKSSEKAYGLFNSIVYNKENSYVLDSSCLIKTHNDVPSQLKALKKHAELKLIKTIKLALLGRL